MAAISQEQAQTCLFRFLVVLPHQFVKRLQQQQHFTKAFK
jgi:hypothetical protein